MCIRDRVKYFPNRPGFATGLAIMGFGFASLIAGPLMQFLVAQVGLVNNFIILGIIYLVVMGASSLYLKAPQPKQDVYKRQILGSILIALLGNLFIHFELGSNLSVILLEMSIRDRPYTVS